MIAAGKRDQVVYIQSKTMGTDSWGAPSEATWATTKTVFAQVMTPRGSEFVSGGSMDHSQQPIAVIFDYVSGLDASMRLLWQSRPYEIKSVLAVRETNETQISAVWTEGRA